MLIDRFEIVGKGSTRYSNGPIIFCDGTGGSMFRPESDLGITRLMNSTGEGKAVYAKAFRRVPALIDGTWQRRQQ